MNHVWTYLGQVWGCTKRELDVVLQLWRIRYPPHSCWGWKFCSRVSRMTAHEPRVFNLISLEPRFSEAQCVMPPRSIQVLLLLKYALEPSCPERGGPTDQKMRHKWSGGESAMQDPRQRWYQRHQAFLCCAASVAKLSCDERRESSHVHSMSVFAEKIILPQKSSLFFGKKKEILLCTFKGAKWWKFWANFKVPQYLGRKNSSFLLDMAETQTLRPNFSMLRLRVKLFFFGSFNRFGKEVLVNLTNGNYFL